MIKVGMKHEVRGREALQVIDVPKGPSPALMTAGERPAQLPRLPDGHRLFCGYDQGFGECLYLAEGLEDAQQLYDGYATGGAIFPPRWYSAPVLFAQDN